MMLGLSIGLLAGFSRSGDIVTDSSTRLQWQDNTTPDTMTWQEAIDYCEDLVLDGYRDWRLANIRELKSIVDLTKSDPAIDAVFEHTVSHFYWSSTTYASNSVNVWSVYFNYGYQYYIAKSNDDYVRCVRAGQ
jgi:hypothetical protein